MLITLLFLSKLLYLKTIKTNVNYPAIKAGDNVLFLKIPAKKNNFISFYAKGYGNNQKELNMFRLCGVEGDTIEIKEGILYINSVISDIEDKTAKEYVISKKDFLKVKDEVKMIFSIPHGTDSVTAILTAKEISSLRLSVKKVLENKNSGNYFIEGTYSKKWNKDNFGPIVVPKSHLFVLGDNRDYAADSRFFGFININDFDSTAIIKEH